MSHWISSIIKHCCLLHSKGRLPAPISPSEILLLPSNNLFHPQSCEKKKKRKIETVINLRSQHTGIFFWGGGGIFANCTSTYSFFFDTTRFFQIQLSTCIYMCNVCTSSSILMWPLVFTVARSLPLPFLLRCYWCDVGTFAETARINLLLSAYVRLLVAEVRVLH